METLEDILKKFAAFGWDLIAVPARRWLDGKGDRAALIAAIEQAGRECGSCGCELDPLYQRVLAFLAASSE